MLSPTDRPDEILPPDSERLESWKEIANYLGKGATTVRTWERDEGLPVRRQEHSKRGSVVAYKSELDAWRRGRTTSLPDVVDTPEAEPTPPPHARPLWIKGVAGAAVLAGVALTIGWTHGRDYSADVDYQMLTADPGGESQPSFAPGGERFAYATSDGVMAKQVGAGSARLLFSDSNWNICCVRWSPDGKWIAMSFNQRPHEWEIALTDPAGQTRRQMGAGGPHLAWTPDSRALIYTKAAGPTSAHALFEQDLKSTAIKQISFPPEGSWGDIAGRPSPDGRQLVLIRYPSIGMGDIYVSGYGAKEARRVTNLGNWIVGVDWLPDGLNVVFGGMVGRHIGIYRVATSGSEAPKMIEGTEGVNRYPDVVRLSGGRVRIAYVNENWNHKLVRLDLSTGKAGPIARSGVSDEKPDLNALGGLLFESWRSGFMNLWVCDGRCTEPRQITFLREPTMRMAARWSPDGKTIAYMARPAGKHGIFLTGPHGGAPRQLSSGSADEVLSFSADGRSLYIRSSRSGRLEIWRIPVEGHGPAMPITNGGGGEAFESADGKWLYWTSGLEKATLKRRAVAGGSDTIVEAAGLLHHGLWTVSKSSILYWTESRFLYRLDPETGSTAMIYAAAKGERVLTFSASASGIVVWARQGSLDENILAVDLHPPAFWQFPRVW